jgi:hypothetical protein
MIDEPIDLDPQRILQLVAEENPQAFELARRRAIIERQNEIIAALMAASSTTNGEHEQVLS